MEHSLIGRLMKSFMTKILKSSCRSLHFGFFSEWIFILPLHWLENGAKIGPGLAHGSTFLWLNIMYELRTVIAEMFSINFLNLICFLQNLWIDCNLLLFSLVTNPVFEPISKGVTLDLISFSKCWYLFIFNLFAISILVSPGTVSSKMAAVLFFWSRMTTSGFRLVTIKLAGKVPPAADCWPSMSI